MGMNWKVNVMNDEVAVCTEVDFKFLLIVNPISGLLRLLRLSCTAGAEGCPVHLVMEGEGDVVAPSGFFGARFEQNAA